MPTRSVHPDDAEEGRRLFPELIRGDRDAYRREARLLTKDGRTLVTHLALALVRDADGKPDFAIGMAEDVTERKLLEEQLRQARSSRRSAASPAAWLTTSTTC